MSLPPPPNVCAHQFAPPLKWDSPLATLLAGRTSGPLRVEFGPQYIHIATVDLSTAYRCPNTF